MNDMVGKEINENDIVLFPGGNARYGGLKMMVGLVTKITPKRIKLLTAPLVYDEKDFKFSNKTSVKVLNLTNTLDHIESVQKLRSSVWD